MADVIENMLENSQKTIIVSEHENVGQSRKNKMFREFFDQVSTSTTEPTEDVIVDQEVHRV